MIDLLIMIFSLCVEFMKYLSLISGLTYIQINVLVFLVIQPLLILLFFALWRIEKNPKLKS
jgi:hypothetical protein